MMKGDNTDSMKRLGLISLQADFIFYSDTWRKIYIGTSEKGLFQKYFSFVSWVWQGLVA